jgi:hypothetical protein
MHLQHAHKKLHGRHGYMVGRQSKNGCCPHIPEPPSTPNIEKETNQIKSLSACSRKYITTPKSFPDPILPPRHHIHP